MIGSLRTGGYSLLSDITVTRSIPLVAPLIAALVIGLTCALLPLEMVAVLIAGVGLLILALIQPLIGIALVLLTGPLAAVENLRVGGILVSSSQILFLLTIAIWLGYGIARRRIVIPKTPINLFLFLFIAVGTISLIDAPSLRIGIKEEIKWIEIALALIVVTDLGLNWNAIEDRPSLKLTRKRQSLNYRWILGIILLAGISQALIGIWQFGIRGDGPDHFMILDRFYRAFGTFQQPNPFGGFMGMTASLAIGASVGSILDLGNKLRTQIRPRKWEWFWLAFLLMASLLAALALIMSWSRGAWLGFGAGMVILVFLFPKKTWKGVFLLALGLTLSLILMRFDIIPDAISNRVLTISEDFQTNDVRGTLVTIENFAVIERLAHWQAGLDMARENLLLGVGFGNYEVAYEDYRLLNWEHPLGHAHNYYINILAETGIVGTVIYFLLWGVIFFQAIRLVRVLAWPDRGIALGLISAWTALAAHQFFDKLYVNNLYLIFGVMLALQQILFLRHDQTNLDNR